MDDRPAIGIVGLGGMGTLHAENITDLGGRVVAGSDVVDEARESFAVAFDAPAYESAEEMYDAEELDAVVITTPNTFHEPAATGALERGLHVLCEKPLADSLESAEAIADAAAESDAFCMVGFSNRFSAAADVFTAQRERFGEITHIEANYVRRRGIPGLGSWFTNEELSGGGSLIDIGVHAIDFALYLAGFPEVEEVSGVTRANFGNDPDYVDPDDWAGNWDTSEGGFDVDDSVSAFVRCADDTTISLEVSWAANRDDSHEVYVRGTDAGAKLDIGGEDLHVYDASSEGVEHYVDEDLDGERELESHHGEAERFLEAVEADEAPDINTVEEGLVVQKVIDAVYRSSEEGRAVQVE